MWTAKNRAPSLNPINTLFIGFKCKALCLVVKTESLSHQIDFQKSMGIDGPLFDSLCKNTVVQKLK